MMSYANLRVGTCTFAFLVPHSYAIVRSFMNSYLAVQGNVLAAILLVYQLRWRIQGGFFKLHFYIGYRQPINMYIGIAS